MADLLSTLNPQQQQAVAAPPGPILVLAGPGSGKTRVLTYRIAYLVAVLDVPAYKIMAVTFTNKAAREMENRVTSLLEEKAEGLWIGTFHAICGRILRREAEHLPIDRNYVIFDADDQLSLIKRVIREHGLSEKDYSSRQVLDKISSAKNELIEPQDYSIANFRDEIIQSLYRVYQDYLVRSNAVDFDDMLLYATNLLAGNQSIREKYARRFQHVLVDEFQDTNTAQYFLLKYLTCESHNLFIVGDEDQSIYRWRGADYHNVQYFLEDNPGSTTILLEQNYRSTQTILDGAVGVIEQNPNRQTKALFSDRGAGNTIHSYEADDDQDEAAYVVDTIARLVRQGKASESDFAIMYRTNAQSRQFEEAFRRANMNYRLVGAQRFYGRREVRDLIAFLRLIYNPRDEVSLARVINLPPRGIGKVTLESLQSYAQQASKGSGEILLDLAGDSSPDHTAGLGSGASRLLPFAQMLAGWQQMAEKVSLTALFDQVLLDTAYEDYIKKESDTLQDRWANVLELRQVLLEYEDRGLADFLEAMALVADQDTLPDTLDAPTLMTLHAAKGLEFTRVFIVGLDEHYLPHSRSLDDPEALAEERRLFYVGMTRAKDHLYLTRAVRRRSPYGNYDTTLPSRFLGDIPSDLLEGRFSTSPDSMDMFDLNLYQWDRTYGTDRPKKTSAPIEAVQQRFFPEMRVEHPVYGEGVVRNSRMEYGDETVEVYFEGLGLKALVASMSNLAPVED